MKSSRTKIMREAKRFLKRTIEYQEDRDEMPDGLFNYRIEYVMCKKGMTRPETVKAYAYSFQQDKEIYFYPFRKEKTVYENWQQADFTDDLFIPLENGNELVGMTLSCHSVVWEFVEEYHNWHDEGSKGVQLYLAYCKQNGITKQLLQEKEGYDGMDIMTLYRKRSLNKETEKSKKDQER